MNIRKLFAVLAGMSLLAQTVVPSTGVFAATYSEELQDAYDWAYSKSITTMSPIDNANMYGSITRAELAKMLSNWAMNVNGKTPDESLSCEFTDIDSVKGDLHEFIKTSCQLGLMGQGITAFRPYDSISRAEFGTALSRALWGNENEGGTPYYAKHLNALKEAGIMNQIANAESTKEIRGYVMLMLMRSEENSICGDALVKVTCAAEAVAGTYKDCPTACRDNGEDNSSTVVKSGDLAVKVTPATERKALIKGKVSDLDTITLKASEKITVNSITLERFGYSTASDVDAVWLEDAYGNKIADEKSLSSSKDTVTLKIKKEYRDMEESNALTIVLRTTNTAKAGGTIGFKVTDVDASAKNLDLSDYNPYTYDLVEYNGAEVTVSVKGNDKTYNYEAWEYYEVSRLKVKAGASILALNGITLTNKGAVSFTGALNSDDECDTKAWYTVKQETTYCTYTANYSTLDLDEFVSKVKVTADGKEVSGLKYSVSKDNELVLSWNTIEVAINKDVQLVVSVALEGLDEFGKNVRLVLDETADLNAVEKKTGARVSVVAPKTTDPSWKVYTFNGSKIKFSNTKLSSTIDAAQGSEDVVVAKGTVTVGEEVKISELVFEADKANVIEDMTLTVAGESFDASVSRGTTKDTFTFKNVIIEKSGDLELTVDVVDEEDVTGETVTITCGTSNSIAKAIFGTTTTNENGRYEDSREYVYPADVSGSISISKLKVQESKASLKNNNSKTVEFVKDETSDRTTVFKGTYTAKKNDITLKEFAIVWNKANVINHTVGAEDSTAEFYLYVNGEEVGMIDESEIEAASENFDSYTDFSDEVEVAAGKSVDIEVKAVVSPYAKSNNINLDLYLRWEDKNGTAAGFAKAWLTTFKYVINGSLTISDSASMAAKTVALQDNEITVAKFTLKPSKSESVKLDNLVFDFSDLGVTDIENNITVKVGGTEVEVEAGNWDKYWDPASSATKYTKYDATDVDDITEEVEVEVRVLGLEPVEKANNGNYTVDDAVSLTLESVNGILKESTYTRLILPVIVTFDSQSSDGGVTKFKVNVEDYDGGQISKLLLYTAHVNGEWENGTVTDGSTVEVSNQTTPEVVNKVTFDISNDGKTYHVTLEKNDFADYFKTTDGSTLRVSKID